MHHLAVRADQAVAGETPLPCLPVVPAGPLVMSERFACMIRTDNPGALFVEILNLSLPVLEPRAGIEPTTPGLQSGMLPLHHRGDG